MHIYSFFIIDVAFEVLLATKAAKAILQDLWGPDSKDEPDFKAKLAAFYDVIPLPGEALDFFARTPTAILQERSLCEFATANLFTAQTWCLLLRLRICYKYPLLFSLLQYS